MLGRPNIGTPVFIISWPGWWLNASVCIERISAMSSAQVAEVRQEVGQLHAALAVLA